jgi:hypothetical protein
MTPSESDPNYGLSVIPVEASAGRRRRTTPDPKFDEFWAAYPRKIGKAGAQRLWQRVTRKSGNSDEIIDAARRFAVKCRENGTETKYIPHASSWLRDGRYADEVADGDPAEETPAVGNGKSYRLHPDFPAWPAAWGPPEGEPGSWVWAKRPLRFSPDGDLLCPRCGDSSIAGGVGANVFAHPDQRRYEPSNPLETCGGYNVITMVCACGTRLALLSASHKGAFRLTLFSVTAAGPALGSPVEQMFLRACKDVWPPDLAAILAPQFPVTVKGRNFFLDFALTERVGPGVKVGFEIDGHATHSSPTDIARDRQRQRLLEESGWRIVRFGGSEVHRDARRCATEALRHVGKYGGQHDRP